jgi:hypothetical protein
VAFLDRSRWSTGVALVLLACAPIRVDWESDPDVRPRDGGALAWRGWARAEVTPDRDPAERRARVEQAVRRILSGFPCRPLATR